MDLAANVDQRAENLWQQMLHDYWYHVYASDWPKIQKKIDAPVISIGPIHLGPHRYSRNLRHVLASLANTDFENNAYVMGADFWQEVDSPLGDSRTVTFYYLANKTYNTLAATTAPALIWAGVETEIDQLARSLTNRLRNKYLKKLLGM